VPKTTYKYESDYQMELPLKPETQEEPEQVRQRYSHHDAYAEEPDYYRYDPMAFTNQNSNTKRSDFEATKDYKTDFPELQPFDQEDREFQSRSLEIPPEPYRVSDRRSSNYGRSLQLTPAPNPHGIHGGHGEPQHGPHHGPHYGPNHHGPAYPVANDIEQPHQFTHVDAPDTYRAGHFRGNNHHHIRDIKEHSGPHHLEEAASGEFMVASDDQWGERILF
jgi:hypothetical protein